MPEFEMTNADTGITNALQMLAYVEFARQEMAGYYKQMKAFRSEPLDEIFMCLAAWTARMSEIRSNLVQKETKRTMAFRTKEVEPFLEECDRQFKFFSRLQSVRDMEAKLGGGVV